MHRRSNSVRIPKYCLVRYEEDDKLDVFKSDRVEMLSNDPICVGSTVKAPFQGKFYLASVLALNGMYFKLYIPCYVIAHKLLNTVYIQNFEVAQNGPSRRILIAHLLYVLDSFFFFFSSFSFSKLMD